MKDLKCSDVDYIEACELYFQPKRWSTRFGAEEIIAKHIEFVTKGSTEVKKSVPCDLHVAYGCEEEEKVDIFGTHLPNDAPIFVYVHGGFWQRLNKDISSYMTIPLVKSGFKVIIIGYTLCPNTTVPKIVKQIEKAITKCFQYAKENKSRGLSLCGHSAGAQLIASLFQSSIKSLPTCEQRLLKNVFLFSGVYDLTPLICTSINVALKMSYNTAKQISPMFQKLYALKHTKVYIIVAQEDSPAFKGQSILFNRKLSLLGFRSKYICVRDVDHFNLVEHLSDENYELVRLIVHS